MAHKITHSLLGLSLIVFYCVRVVAQQKPPGNGNSLVTVRHFVAPAYPDAAWLARIQGTVVSEVAIKPDGTVDSVNLVSAHPIFRKSVKTALKQWVFEVSTATTLKITAQFLLDADCPLTGSQEPDKRYYVQTQVSADLPSHIDVAPACQSRQSTPESRNC